MTFCPQDLCSPSHHRAITCPSFRSPWSMVWCPRHHPSQERLAQGNSTPSKGCRSNSSWFITNAYSRVLTCFNCVLTICLGLAMRVFLWRTLENLWEHTEMMSKLGVVGVTLPQLSELLLLVSTVARTVRPNWDQFSNWSLSQWNLPISLLKGAQTPNSCGLGNSQQDETETQSPCQGLSNIYPWNEDESLILILVGWFSIFLLVISHFHPFFPAFLAVKFPCFLLTAIPFTTQNASRLPLGIGPKWPRQQCGRSSLPQCLGCLDGVDRFSGHVDWLNFLKLPRFDENTLIWFNKNSDCTIHGTKPRLRVKSRNIPDFKLILPAQRRIPLAQARLCVSWGVMLSCWIFPTKKIMRIWGFSSAKLDDS